MAVCKNKNCNRKFHACDSCSLTYSWEYEYCCDQCWKTSEEYKKVVNTLEVFFNSLAGWQQVTFIDILDELDDEILYDWLHSNKKELISKMEQKVKKESENDTTNRQI